MYHHDAPLSRYTWQDWKIGQSFFLFQRECIVPEFPLSIPVGLFNEDRHLDVYTQFIYTRTAPYLVHILFRAVFLETVSLVVHSSKSIYITIGKKIGESGNRHWCLLAHYWTHAQLRPGAPIKVTTRYAGLLRTLLDEAFTTIVSYAIG